MLGKMEWLLAPFTLLKEYDQTKVTKTKEPKCVLTLCVCVCVWSLVKGGEVVKHAIPILNHPPHDAGSIPWGSVVLPLGTLGRACTRGSKQVPVSWFGLRGHSLGAVPQPRLRPCQVFIASISGEAQMCVCSPSSSRDSSDLKGQL